MIRPVPLTHILRFVMFVVVLLITHHSLLITAHGQSASATLSGTVEDQQGAVVPGVEVTVLNVETSARRQAKTHEDGSFTIPLLPPGRYSITARREGFAPVEVPNVVLNVADQKSLQIQLKAGNINAQVQVINEAPLINESPAVATVIDRRFVENLPLNGRSFSSLVLLTPGVTVTTSNGRNNDAGQFSVNGQRASTNYFTVDGVGANIGIGTDLAGAANMALAGAYPGQSAFGGTNNLVSIDALEEFKIQTSSYTAESGRQPGGQIQLVTRAGTNRFHGTLFEYFRNEAMDARNYFNFKPDPKPALRQNQFGGTFSGPLPFFNFGEGGPFFNSGKNRTFFFFSYEGQRLRLPSSGIQYVASLRLRQVAAPALRPILNAFPRPTGPEPRYDDDFDPSTPDVSTGFAPFNYAVSNPSNLDATSIRVDHNIGSKLTLFGRFNESPSDTTRGVAIKTQILANTRTLTLGVTSLFSPRLSNELRFNHSRQHGQQRRVLTTIGGAVPIDPTMLTSGYSGSGTMFFGWGDFGAAIQGGSFIDNYQRQFNVVDNLSLAHGAHQFKFGIDYRRLAPIYGTQDQQGTDFLSEAAVVSGIIDFLSIHTIQPARPQFSNFSAYGQDTWKTSTRLTLDLGVRWEFNPPPTETEGKMPPAAFGIVGTDVTRATLAPPGTKFYKTFYTAFAPRFGAAYQLNQTSGQETVLRGGFGVYYDLGSGTAANGWPFIAEKSLPNAQFPLVPFPVPASVAVRPGIVLVTTLPTTSTITSLDQNLKLPYTLQWNVAVEQSLGAQQTVSLSYVGAAARRLLTTHVLNNRPRDPVTGAALPRPNPNFGRIFFSTNGSTSDYKALQAQYRTRLKRGLQALVNYTWSHATDEVSSDIESFNLERGNADFDVRHNLSAAVSYALPALNSIPVLKSIFGDWSVDGIVHAQSGRPVDLLGFSSFTRPDGSSFNLRPDLVPGVPVYIDDPTVPGGRRFNAAAFTRPPGIGGNPNRPSRQGNVGRNVLRELPLYQVDLALGRTFRFRESLKLQLKAEAFNVFNHPMFGDYETDFSVPETFGVPLQTANGSLGGLSSLYQLGGPRSIQFSARLSF